MRIVHQWLAELVELPGDVELVAREIALRGFEVASVENGVIDFEITANRPDCLSHAGIAREAAVIWSRGIRGTAGASPAGDVETNGGEPPVAIEAPDLCPRYTAQLFDVKVGPSPSWLAERLEQAGVRPINNVVDVTNYVMLEIGQPMHAFDLRKLAGGGIVVRRARAGEKLKTLDGIERPLDAEMLVIADAERPVAIGGVMGGLDSEIGTATSRMLLESAYFLPASVRRTSKRLGLKTEASTRFERGADIGAPVVGLRRAAQLLEQIGAARPGARRDVYPSRRAPVQLVLRADRIARVLGMTVPAAEVARVLAGLGFVAEATEDQSWTVTVPTFRPDVVREVDLIEEVGRHYGFDRLPVTFPALVSAPLAPDERIERDRKIRSLLTAAGVTESMTFSFIERQAALPFCPAGLEPAAIANPLSEKFAVLRPSLLPGLIDSCSHNRRRGQKDVRLFETGSRFTPRQAPDAAAEGRAVAFAWSGTGSVAHWSAPPAAVDFFDAKGIVELLCTAFGVPAEFERAETPFLVRGRAAEVRSGGRSLGVLGLLVPAIAESRGLPAGEEIYVGELDVDALAAAARAGDLRAESLPRFPSIVRDISILVAEALPAAAVRGTIRAAAPQTLVAITEFDRYQGTGVPEGRVSLSLRLTFRAPDRTLTDEEAQAATDAIVTALHREHDAARR